MTAERDCCVATVGQKGRKRIGQPGRNRAWQQRVAVVLRFCGAISHTISSMCDDHSPTGTGTQLEPLGADSPIRLDRAIQGRIGAELRAMYGRLSNQPLPERLLALVERIAQLDRKEPDER